MRWVGQITFIAFVVIVLFVSAFLTPVLEGDDDDPSDADRPATTPRPGLADWVNNAFANIDDWTLGQVFAVVAVVPVIFITLGSLLLMLSRDWRALSKSMWPLSILAIVGILFFWFS